MKQNETFRLLRKEIEKVSEESDQKIDKLEVKKK